MPKKTAKNNTTNYKTDTSRPSLYPFQEATVMQLLHHKKIAILKTGMGKTACAMRWLYFKTKMASKTRVLIVTTATKAKSGDMEREADLWNGEEWRQSLRSFDVISWHKFDKWTLANTKHLGEYVYVFDEIQKCKGYTSGMGLAYRRVCARSRDWSGYTATPGDRWIDLMPYFVGAGLVRNKTDFMRQYCVVQTFKGYPEITHYLNEPTLIAMWRSITYIPDTAQAERELPAERHQVIEFKAPAYYKTAIKERVTEGGEPIETTMGLCHYLRQLCFTKEKQEWVKDFLENLGDNCVFFCNYIEEENVLCEIAKKALPKGAKVWRIDGTHHDIPTADTIGKYDIVVAHYASGGEALNLQFLHYWVSVSPNYSFSTSVQARGRIKRIGQRHFMVYWYLKAKGTIEDTIYKCLKEKHDFSEKTWEAELDGIT